jgi:hypothetical protein
MRRRVDTAWNYVLVFVLMKETGKSNNGNGKRLLQCKQESSKWAPSSFNFWETKDFVIFFVFYNCVPFLYRLKNWKQENEDEAEAARRKCKI